MADIFSLMNKSQLTEMVKQSKLMQVTNRCKQYDALSDGTETGVTYRINYTALADCFDVSLVYGNYRTTNNVPDTPNSNNITIKASIEIGADIYPIFFNGADTITIKGGGLIKSDPIGIDLPKGTTFYIRTYVSVSSLGEKWVIGMPTFSTNGEGKTTGDITLSGTPVTTTGYCYHPLAVLGNTKSSSVILIGDSIFFGSGDTINGTNLESGYATRALKKASIPFINIAISSEKASNFKSKNSTYRINLTKYTKNAICDYGINDIMSNYTLDAIKTSLLGIWGSMANRGLKIFQTTITPHTTSIDSWVTITNQTIANTTQETVRTQLNDWIRTCPAPLSGYFEIADLAETSRNSGIWKAGYTADGLHPNATGHIDLSNGIDATKLV